jgi:phosphate:Na+ symporter
MVPEVIDEQKSLESPVYLTPASMAYPQTGIKALLDETKRLYENIIYSVIVHGLNAHRSDVESGKKLKSIVEKAEPAIELDIDAIYYNKIKVIYSKIVEYATDLQSKFTLDPQKIDLIRKILIANRRMVDVVKGMKALHRNVTVYSKSENPYMRIEYNALRKMILKVIREINLLGDLADDQELTAHLEKLEKLRNKAKKSDVLISGTIDRLIRENAITDAMASSLMNDSAHAIEICMNLTAHAELLYGRRDTILENVPVEKFMLEEEEPL